jgi:hypothetical protein
VTLENILADFQLLDDWEDRYRYVIELGRALPPLPEAARTEANSGAALDFVDSGGDPACNWLELGEDA